MLEPQERWQGAERAARLERARARESLPQVQVAAVEPRRGRVRQVPQVPQVPLAASPSQGLLEERRWLRCRYRLHSA